MGEMLHRLHVSHYPPNEEIANVITHGLGVILASVGLYFLASEAYLTGDPWKLWSCVTFGLCMIACYLCSTLYHAVTNLELKHRMRIADHIGIYLLIAGSYTPFVLGPLNSPWGWTILGTVMSGKAAHFPCTQAWPGVTLALRCGGYCTVSCVTPRLLLDAICWGGGHNTARS